MKRMSDEPGVDAGFRNFGRFALSAIPFILGAAACIWLGFWMTAHGFFNQLSQEERRAIYVGAEQRPKAKLKVETPNDGCVKIERVDLDGSSAAVYLKSYCHEDAKFLQLSWQLIAPDGTLLASDSHYLGAIGGPDVMRPGDKAEAVLEGGLSGVTGIKLDSRAAAVRFEVRR